MNDKIQTSVWIKKDLYIRMKTEELNFTKWVNDNLEVYFELNRKNDILKRLRDLDAERKTLSERLSDIADKESQSMTGKIESDAVFQYIFAIFCKRRKNIGENIQMEQKWINSPKNQQRCALMNMEEKEVLEMLRNAYNHLSEDELEEIVKNEE